MKQYNEYVISKISSKEITLENEISNLTISFYDNCLVIKNNLNNNIIFDSCNPLLGVQGPQGAQGAQGFIGISGVKGVIGVNGAQGIQGDSGFNGEKGTSGTQGAQGVKGDQGDKGTKGDKGVSGAQGAQGAVGADGDKGDTGRTGNRGVQGAQGAKGANGTDGTQGPTGLKGVPGSNGPAGAQGIQGNAGPIGEKGASGVQGPQGFFAFGTAGAQGAQGPMGQSYFPLSPGYAENCVNTVVTPGVVVLSTTTGGSDIELKENIRVSDIDENLIKLLKVKKYKFDKNLQYIHKLDPDLFRFGFIAQDVEQALADLNIKNTNIVQKDPSIQNYKIVNIIPLITAAIKTIQNNDAKIFDLENRLNALIARKKK